MGSQKRPQESRGVLDSNQIHKSANGHVQPLESRGGAGSVGERVEGQDMSQLLKPDQEILRTRIRFALRRATGFVFDIDAMLRKPELRARRIGLWRDVATGELNSLLDQLETEFQADAEHDEEERTVVLRREELEALRR